MKYIYHHLGLGDHIICNGLIRHFLENENENEISIFCKTHNFENVSYMFRDDERIKIINVENDTDVENFIHKNQIQDYVIKVGFGKLNQQNTNTFDEAFYKQLDLPFDYRFSKFFFKRDIEKEKKIYNAVNPNNEKYIFTHDIDDNRIRKDLKIINNPKEYKIFDLIYLIENAEEVHLMESSLKCLVNSIKMEKPKFFYHQYVRKYGDFLNSLGINKFEIIK